MLDKLLSHRLRGYGAPEHTLSALRAACAAPPHYLEIDTRITRDGNIVVYHGPQTGEDLGGTYRLAETPRAVLDTQRYANGDPLLDLSTLLQVFHDEADQDHHLCIDIKDFGTEEQHVSMVHKAGLSERVTFVSWMPQSLLRIHEIAPEFPLILSHWNLLGLGWVGGWISRILSGRMFPISWFVAIGRDHYATALDAYSVGYQHGLVCTGLPSALRDCLVASGGGICVHHSVCKTPLIDYCRAYNLHLWVFSARKFTHFARLAETDGIDVVFSDDAPEVFRHVRREPPHV